MRRLLLAFLFAFFILSVSAFGQSSYVNIFSTVSYNAGTNQVTAQAYTQPSYMNYAYYTTYVSGSLRDDSGTSLGFQSTGGGMGQATVNFNVTGTGCRYYSFVAGHWQLSYYYVNNYYYDGYYHTGYWDYFYYSYYNFDQAPGGGPYWGNWTYFSPGSPRAIYSSNIIFGATQVWTQGNCGVRPTAIITAIKAVGKGHKALVHVEVDNNPNNEAITLTLNSTSGNAAAKFTGNGGTDTNTRTITSTGDMEITGVTESNRLSNMRLQASLPSTPSPIVLNRMDFTVIKATLSVRTSGTVSSDNSKFSAWNTVIGRTTLGGPTMNSGTLTPYQISHGIEVVATILPSDFAESMKINRTIVESFTYTGQNITLRWFACPDTSAAIYRDDLPQSGGSNGKIYSLDAPGLRWEDTNSPGLIGRRRSNFIQWVTINQQNGNNLEDVRVSDDIQWFHRLSIVKNSGPGFSVINDVPNDNQIGAGETPLAWDLSGDPASPPPPNPCPALAQPQ